MADPIQKVLAYIVDRFVVQDEQKDIDLNASASESGADIESEKLDVAEREVDRAWSLADAFREGLILAYRARAAGRAEIALDDRKPEEDRMADALIRFLVGYDFAASRVEETEPLHYVYHVTIDWDRLATTARDAGVDLDGTLRQLAA